MRDMVTLRCGKCGQVHHYNVKFIEGVVKGVKKNRYLEAAKQLQEKRGPFYDKWLAAMEKRGEQMRCRDCMGYYPYSAGNGYHYCTYRDKKVNPGQFSCHRIVFFEG